MKKKGLIISTVVMVVVLLASLTTATYAWFSSTAEARVAPIGMTATAAEGILLGVRKDTTSTAVTRNDFVNGDVNWTASATTNKTLTDGTWAGTTGFGSLLTPMVGSDALNLNISEAMTKNDATPAAGLENALFKKAPAGENDQTAGVFSPASANVDYIQLDLGLIASTHKTIDQIIGTIKVTPTDTDQIGMAAAVHFEIAIKAPGATEWTVLNEIDAYDGREAGNYDFNTDANASSYAGTLNTTDKTWEYDFGVWKAASADNALSTGAVKDTTLEVVEVKLLAWIEGSDPSCTTSYTGTGATIDISFDYSKVDSNDYAITNGVATEAADVVVVNYVMGDGAVSTLDPQYLVKDSKITLKVPTAETGYTFKGWSTDGTDTGIISGSDASDTEYTVAANVTLTARWETA